MQNFAQRVEAELRENILPFWIEKAIDHQKGGFFGRVSAEGVSDPTAPKGGILAARIL